MSSDSDTGSMSFKWFTGNRSISLHELLVRLGGAVMGISVLLSWLELGPDSFPNISGIGESTSGSGLVFLVAGLFLLLRSSSFGVNMGLALGGLSIVLIFVVRTITTSNPLEPLDIDRNPDLGIGALVGIGGAALAVLGSGLDFHKSINRYSQKIELLPAATGAILAVVASFLLAWGITLDTAIQTNWSNNEFKQEILHGVNTDVITGIPIVILGVISLCCVLAVITTAIGSGFAKQLSIAICQMAGIAIALLAATDTLRQLLGFQLSSPAYGLSGFVSLWSGPLVALVGGVVLARSICPVEAEELPAADAED